MVGVRIVAAVGTSLPAAAAEFVSALLVPSDRVVRPLPRREGDVAHVMTRKSKDKMALPSPKHRRGVPAPHSIRPAMPLAASKSPASPMRVIGLESATIDVVCRQHQCTFVVKRVVAPVVPVAAHLVGGPRPLPPSERQSLPPLPQESCPALVVPVNRVVAVGHHPMKAMLVRRHAREVERVAIAVAGNIRRRCCHPANRSPRCRLAHRNHRPSLDAGVARKRNDSCRCRQHQCRCRSERVSSRGPVRTPGRCYRAFAAVEDSHCRRCRGSCRRCWCGIHCLAVCTIG